MKLPTACRWTSMLGWLVLATLDGSVGLGQEAVGKPAAPLWLSIPGNPHHDLPGKGKKVLLVSGDEEYRSEEALPQLAKILATHHGFDTTVLFAINPETSWIDPNYSFNIPGLEALKDADLMIIATRFRELPDDQMQHIVDYLKAGKPLIGLRTATHAFNYQRDPEGKPIRQTKFADWGFDSRTWPGGFGQQVLGDTWVSHHGEHGRQSTRGVVHAGAEPHPILRGVKDVWGPTDVYGINKLSQNAFPSTILLDGQVLTGMSPDDPAVPGKINDPMQPLAWLKQYQVPAGLTGQAFCTTMGAATDLSSEDLRRLLVNASYYLTGLEAQIPPRAEVAIVGRYEPSQFGFQRQADYWAQKKLTPQRLGE